MESKKPHTYVSLFIIIVSLILNWGCNEPELKSQWRDRDIIIDGIDKEWEDCRLYYDEDTRTTIGTFNDKKYLFINLTTTDHMIAQQIIQQGFTVWFDPSGGKEKQLGIFYPTGIMDRKMFKNQEPGRNKSAGNTEPEERVPHEYPEDGEKQNSSRILDDMMENMPHVIDIKVSDGAGDWDTIFLEEKSTSGIQARVNYVEGRLTYELKIPFIQNQQIPYGIVVSKRGKIGVGFETEKMEAPFGKHRGPMEGGMGRPKGGGMGRPGGDDLERPEGGSPGGYRGGMGGHGGKGRGFKNLQAKSLLIWTKIKLASEP